MEIALPGAVFKLPNHEGRTEVKCGYTGACVLVANQLGKRYRGSRKYELNADGTLEEKPKKIQRPNYEKTTIQQRQYKVNKSEVKARIQAMINCQTGYKELYFFTISFPPVVDDNTAYKILNSFLTTARTRMSLTHYVWVAERQKIGTIHYHIATSNKMPVLELNNVVKNLLKYHISKGTIKWNYSSAFKYNGVDIAKDRITRKVTNFADESQCKYLAKYLTKYATKGEELFNRQAWQASKSVSALFTHVCMSVTEFDNTFISCIDTEKPLYESEYYMFYPWKDSIPKAILNRLSEINQTIVQVQQ